VQPTTELALGPRRTGLSGQNEKGRLECIFGIERVTQDRPAYGHDHRAVPRDEGREGRFIASNGETPEQLRVRESRGAIVAKKLLNERGRVARRP
jgi:hypothetical protein